VSFLNSILRVVDRAFPARIAHAHCDIPCGIYDPHHAQVAAHTVIRMIDLVDQIAKPGANATPKEWDTYAAKLARHQVVKEQHAELAKHEVRILWGDYFKPEHVQQFPDLHEAVWKVMKLGSKGKQEMDRKQAEDLLEAVNKIAEIFWKTKSVSTARVKPPYNTNAETVIPKYA
jgi:nickel superoxide dismutase